MKRSTLIHICAITYFEIVIRTGSNININSIQQRFSYNIILHYLQVMTSIRHMYILGI